HAGNRTLEARLHAERDLEDRRQVLLESNLELAERFRVRVRSRFDRDSSRLALDLRAHLGIAVCLALCADLRRLDLAFALRLFVLDRAATGAGAFALALGLD